MEWQRIRPASTAAFSALLFVAGWTTGPIAAGGTPVDEEDEPVLLGVVTREEIEAAVPDWVQEEMSATPDPEAATALLAAIAGAEVIVYLGTWCEDSRHELARLWRSLDEVGAFRVEEIRYIGVDRDKLEPAEWVAASGLQLVPTFVVRRQGLESGRIVESSPDGIERDLLALLVGDKQGVVSASADLQIPADEE